MRGKCAEIRWQSAEPLRSLSWHNEGKHFVSSHTDGSLCTWPLRPTPKPQYHNYPHGKYHPWFGSQPTNYHLGDAIVTLIARNVIHHRLVSLLINDIWNVSLSPVVSAKTNKEGKLESCKPIHKVDLKTSRTSGETFTIFSGGLSMERGGKSPCITVMQGKLTTVLEMEHAVVDFVTICESPWASGE